MPTRFKKCVKQGGRVRTVKGKRFGMKKPTQYRHICFFIDGKGAVLGEVRVKKRK